LRFPTTEWDQIARAGNPAHCGAGVAMAELCRRYWYPVYCFIRSRGYSSTDATDLTQEYFTRLLEGRLLDSADRSRGRFRALLRKDCGFFLSDVRDREGARKRGNGVPLVSLSSDAD